MKRILIIILLAAPLIFFGGRLFSTISANSTVNNFWSGWKMSQSAPIAEAMAEQVSVEDRTGYLFRAPSGTRTDVVSFFANGQLWWVTDAPEGSFTITSTKIDGNSAIVTSQVKAKLFGRDRVLTIEFKLVKQDSWDICGITFVEMT